MSQTITIPKPNDVLVWRDKHSTHKWRVVGVHLGGEGQESLIEMESVTHTPGWTGEWETHPRVFVPEVLIRTLEIAPPWEVHLGNPNT